ncbi:MAG TPA: glutaredoxin family protein [Burkholderiales bacterium]|nr:glutaredoxin family protein [Burkholderiales bacterium]
MKSMISFLSIFLFAMVSANAAQLYRWVDSKGNVEWRDTPPPASAAAKKVEQRKIGDNVISTSQLPYSVQLAIKNSPVTLWATDCGPPCSSARTHLSRRGIPFTEKAPQSDLENFKKVSPGSEVPILLVGKIQLKGYLESDWDSTLDSAGYPRTAIATNPTPAAPAPKPAADGASPR